MSTIKIPELKRELKQFEHKELIEMIVELHKLNKETKQLLSNKLLGEEAINAHYEQTRKIIKDQLSPAKGEPKLKLKEAESAIADYKKMTGDVEGTADLQLYFFELGMTLADSFVGFNDSFYTKLINAFADVAEACRDDLTLAERFKPRVRAALNQADTADWDFYEELADIYKNSNFYENDDDE
ncbi:DUF6155 family protein [Salisediminibacterium halotolerans]|uniref:Uncharacterized protein n=1 Tax=Salisediminibacterium halotolerans TaxID=517425 RepID=A0A1H9W3F2_9BACI|nr:DUF6155 family protein [Salisediminibacterium haloalkalitolerans]SES28309.1 hypothetical protein SAMN05444126_1279 [Salisediminibacterium haloalkalitolerans]